LLVEADELAREAGVHVLDVRGKDRYREGHVPGAVHVSASDWQANFKARPDPDAWAKRLGAAGVDLGTRVVVCGGEDVRDAARVWWILRYWGVKDVRLLHGGWPAWQKANGKVEAGEVKPAAKAVRLAPQPDRRATKDEILRWLKDSPPQLVDTRSKEEYCGEAGGAARWGAIPGAVHLEWAECLDPKSKRFRPAPELAKLLADRRVDVNRPAVTYCQSGGRSSVVAFVLELMGGDQVRNYHESWSEWGNADDTPVEKKP
jgi:thiosulfate/3-mercaptopyruvate sulfurtransferase